MTHRRLATYPHEIQHLWLKDDGEPMNNFIITPILIERKIFNPLLPLRSDNFKQRLQLLIALNNILEYDALYFGKFVPAALINHSATSISRVRWLSR
jgi:hypothetical protein